MSIWKLLFGFKGRIRRLQWWLGSLMAFGAFLGGSFLLGLVMGLTMPGGYSPESVRGSFGVAFGGGLVVMYALYFWMILALAVKRFHDRDHTGFWVLLSFVPIGNIWVFIELGFLDGTQGGNRFGRSPKGLGIDKNELIQTF